MASKSTKPINYHKRILAALSDGQWHNLRDLYNRVARFIGPCIADTEYRRRHPDWKEVKEADRVAQGRKRLIFLSLNSMHHHRKLVQVRGGKDWERQYRLTPTTKRAGHAQKTKFARRRSHKPSTPKPSPAEQNGKAAA